MTKVGQFFKDLEAHIQILFSNHFPKGWVDVTNQTVAFIQKLKSWEQNPNVKILASLLPKGLGTKTLADLQHFTTQVLAKSELLVGAEEAFASATTPEDKANAVLEYLVKHIAELDGQNQGKHYEDLGVKILTHVLDITETEAKLALNMQYGRINKVA